MLSPFNTVLDAIQKWAAVTPGQDAIVFKTAHGQTARLNYEKLYARIQKRAAFFRQLPLFSRVGLIAPHGPIFLVDALAIMTAGHCLVPINGQLSAGLRDELIERTGLHALLEFGATDLRLYTGHAIDQAHDENFRALKPAYLRFTSGSTGQRKGVLLGHQTILQRTNAANTRLKITPADKVLCLLPMVDHLVVSILLYLRYGATVLLVEKEEDGAKMAHLENATVIYGAPVQYRHFNAALPALRLAISTAQGLSHSIAKQFLESTGKPLVQALGIMEAGLLTLNEERAATEPLLTGTPMPPYQISTSGSEENPGEIYIDGPGMLDAYVSPWRPRSSIVGPQGLASGDIGFMDANNCLHLVGREKNRIHLDGESFFCEEVEAVINQHPSVQESLVSVENNHLSAQIVNQPGAVSPTALNDWIQQKLPEQKVPTHIRMVEELPKTPTGKLARPVITQRIVLPSP